MQSNNTKKTPFYIRCQYSTLVYQHICISLKSISIQIYHLHRNTASGKTSICSVWSIKNSFKSIFLHNIQLSYYSHGFLKMFSYKYNYCWFRIIVIVVLPYGFSFELKYKFNRRIKSICF
jgi:hypothetical protein